MKKIGALEEVFNEFYTQVAPSHHLVEGILYSLRAGGKRIRPMLFLEVLESFGVDLVKAHFQLAAALEMIHTASLIHDDLPAMDNDDYRRGVLTNHKVYGEDKAILAGDSLFLDPFALMASADLPAPILIQLVRDLSLASGTFGMVAGQVLDMEGEEKYLSLQELEKIHINKTGQLLIYPFKAAGLVLELEQEESDLLIQVGRHIGLAFQIRDDILDEIASFEDLGKTPGKDAKAGKSTYPRLLGLDQAKLYLNQTLDQAVQAVALLEKNNQFSGTLLRNRIESLRINE